MGSASSRSTWSEASTTVAKKQYYSRRAILRSTTNRLAVTVRHDADNEASDEEIDQRFKKIKSNFKEIALAKSAEEIRNEILNGSFDVECPNKARIVRIFTSSTFTDTQKERDALAKRVYPKLKSFCQELGYDFQVVDMRWGIRDESTDNHMTTELCAREIEQCQKLSTGPNFVTFISHKYGNRPLPRCIEESEFRTLMCATMDQEDITVLTKWYKKDENLVPPCYTLQPISKLLPQYWGKGEKHIAAREVWRTESSRIQMAVIRSAQQTLPKSKSLKYEISVTETEIHAGMLQSKDQDKHCLAFRRIIRDIHKQPMSTELKKYLDYTGFKEADEVQRQKVKELTEEKIPSVLPSSNLFINKVSWSPEGINPEENIDHRRHINKLCTDFEKAVKHMVTSAVGEEELKEGDDKLFNEVLQHCSLCQSRVETFHGRKDELESIKKYLVGPNRSPLVVHGESGSGKTSIMAMVAKLTKTWLHPKALVILRFIGTTQDSTNVASLLASVIAQIRSGSKLNNNNISTGTKLKRLVECFKKAITEATKDRPIVILLDSLDQLAASNGARSLAWLPLNLPPGAKLVVSTVPVSENESFSNLKNLFGEEKDFVHVRELTEYDADSIIDNWLRTANRALRPNQRLVLMNAFRRCQLPLFLKISFGEACRWKSYDPPSQTALSGTVRAAIANLLSRIENVHGELLVSRALGYLTLAKKGLTEGELEDVLSCDDDVLDEVYQYWTPPIRRLPTLLIVRIRAELEHYLVHRDEDGVKVLHWFHRQFREAAHSRYCSDEQQRRRMHSALAEFFRGTWAGSAKPFKDAAGTSKADRYVAAQPLSFNMMYNLRTLNNLPYHLIHAEQITLLKNAVILNLEFLLLKLKATSLRCLLEDLSLAKEQFTHDEEIKLVLDALQLSQEALLYDPNQLPSQLIGRFPPEKERIFGDPHDLPSRYLMPDKKILIPPGGQLVHSLAGHSQMVTCLDITSDGRFAVTASHDRSVRVWDIFIGSQHMVVEDIVDYPEHIQICSWDEIIAVNSDIYVLGIHLHTGRTLYKIQNYVNTSQENLVACGTNRDKLVIPVGQSLLVFRADTGQRVSEISNHSMADEKFQCFDPISGQGRYIAVAAAGSPVLRVADIMARQFIHNRQMLEPLSERDKEDMYIEALAICPNLQTIAFASSIENDVYICDLHTLNTLQVIGGRNIDFYQKFTFTIDGKVLYFPNGSMLTCVNLENGKMKDRLVHPSKVTDVITRDLMSVVSISEDNSVRIWDLVSDSAHLFCHDGIDGLDIPNSGQRIKELTFISMKADSDAETRVTKDFVFREIVPLENGRYVLIHSEDMNHENIQIYDVVRKRPVRNAKLLSGLSLTACDVTAVDTAMTIVSTGARKGNLVDMKTMSVIGVLQGTLSQYGSDMVVRQKSKEVLTFTRGRRNIKIYSLESGLTTAVLKTGRANRLAKMMLSRNEQLLAVSSEFPGPLLVFDIKRRVCLHALEAKTLRSYASLTNAFFTKCASYLLLNIVAAPPGLSEEESYMIVVNTKTGRVDQHLMDKDDYKKHIYTLTSKRVSAQSACHLREMLIVVGCQDGVIRAWNAQTGTLVNRLVGHSHEVSGLSVCADGSRIVSYSDNRQDGAIRLWNGHTFECLASFKADNELSHIQLTSDGNFVLAGDTMTREVVTWTLEGGNEKPTRRPNYPIDFHDERLNVTLTLDEYSSDVENEQDPDSDVDEHWEGLKAIHDTDDEDDDIDNEHDQTLLAPAGSSYDGDHETLSSDGQSDLSLM